MLRSLVGAFTVALAATTAWAEPPPAGPALLTHDQLQARLDDPKAAATLRLLDVRPKGDYDKGHIPGALWVDTKPASTLAARVGGLTDQDAWEAGLAPLGIGPGTDVYVHDAHRQLHAARVWWLPGSKALAKRGGHVPTACRPEWTDLVDKDGKFLGPTALKSKLAASGLKAGPVIMHCQGGGRASVASFA